MVLASSDKELILVASGPHYLYRLRPGAKACLNYGKLVAHRACLVILLTTNFVYGRTLLRTPSEITRSHVKRDSQEFFLIRPKSYHIRYPINRHSGADLN
jgi:hypothetical protein